MSLIKFLNNSRTFNGFTFQGCYDMDQTVLLALYEHYKYTGENLLDAYSEFQYLLWEADLTGDYLEITRNPYEYASIRSGLSKLRRLRIADPDDLRLARVELSSQLKRYYAYQEKKHKTRRREAGAFTKSKGAKEYILNKYGWECVKCGSGDKITIDHIEPIARGGKDELSNIQPLCSSCNSKKGIKSNEKFMNHV